MLELIQSQWNNILETLQKTYEISPVSYTTFLQPLKVHSIQNDVIIVLVPDNNEVAIKFIKKKFYSLFKVVINEMFDSNYDIEFTSANRLESVNTINKEETPVVSTSDSLTNRILDANLNPKYTFDSFVVGGSNNFAYTYAVAVAESPGEIVNPLFIYGGVGLGKTHLMHAIANYILEHNENARVLCVTSEKFTNDLINAIRGDKQSAVNEFRERYRNIDVLLVDDIQFIIGKERSQEEFFHTFNTLYEAKKQIIVTSDKPPKEMKTLEDRLKSRFECGLTVDISSPDYETKMAILKKKAEIEGYDINDSIFQYIATNIHSNIRELEGALTKIHLYSKLNSKISNSPMTIDTAKEVLKDLISPNTTREVTPELIIQTVADHFSVNPADLSSKKKSQNIAYPRQIAMYLCRNLTDISLDAIGSILGGRDHTTVIHGITKITTELSEKEDLKDTIEVLTKKIKPE